MGSWFVRYFTAKGSPTILSDIRLDEACAIAEDMNAKLANTNQEAVKNVDAAIICVPIKKTEEVIREIAPSMRQGAVLAEISSIKGSIIDALREAKSLGIRPLSLHPMFGPLTESLTGNVIVVVPVIDRSIEHDIARHLFEEAEITVAEMGEHDQAMAVALSLTYFINLAFASVLSETDLISMKRLAGTTFTVQLALAESIVAEDPSLVSSLLEENRFTELYINRFINEANVIRDLIRAGPTKFNELYDNIRDSLSRDPNFLKANEMRFEAYKALKTLMSASTQ